MLIVVAKIDSHKREVVRGVCLLQSSITGQDAAKSKKIAKWIYEWILVDLGVVRECKVNVRVRESVLGLRETGLTSKGMD